jgi:hypothetical protein
MRPILILDRGLTGIPNELEYPQTRDTRGFFNGGYPTAGEVHVYQCGACGRILVFDSVPRV